MTTRRDKKGQAAGAVATDFNMYEDNTTEDVAGFAPLKKMTGVVVSSR